VELMAYYLMDGLQTANSLRKSSIVAGQARYIQTLDVAQACFILGIILSYFVLFVPVIRALNVMLKHARQTLLLLPDEAVMGVMPIRNLMKEYAKACK
jgi:predicted RNA methylase